MSSKAAKQAIGAWAEALGYRRGTWSFLSTTIARVAIGERTVTFVEDGEASGLRVEISGRFGRWARPFWTAPAARHARTRIAAFAALDAVLGEPASMYVRGDLVAVYVPLACLERDTAGVVRAIAAVAAGLEALDGELDACPRPSYAVWYVAIALLTVGMGLATALVQLR